MMNKANHELFSLENDRFIKEINGLKWLPWIGKEYFSSKRRVLIVGESHYLTGSESNLKETELQDFTRNVVQTFCVDHKKPQSTFDNINRCLFGKKDMKEISLEMREDMWRQLAFYNFVQRPMKTNKKRPTKGDMQTGWNVFAELIKILKPSKCIFIGFAAADCYNPFKCKRSKETVGKYAARRFVVKLDEQSEIPCIAIKHTSQYFSWKKWRNFLKNEEFLF